MHGEAGVELDFPPDHVPLWGFFGGLGGGLGVTVVDFSDSFELQGFELGAKVKIVGSDLIGNGRGGLEGLER